MLAPPIFVLPVHPHNSPLLVNASLLARVELSVPPVLVFRVILIAPIAQEPLSANVQHAPRSFPFSHLDVVYQRVVNPSFSTRPVRHARLAIRVAQVALILAPIIVWHVRALLKFCALDHVYLRIVLGHRMLFLTWAFVFLIWCKYHQYQLP